MVPCESVCDAFLDASNAPSSVLSGDIHTFFFPSFDVRNRFDAFEYFEDALCLHLLSLRSFVFFDFSFYLLVDFLAQLSFSFL